MAYNHAQAEAEWKREEHARVLKMRKAGMSKEDILTMVVYDRSVFNSNRRFESHLDDSEMDIENAADCEGFGELYTVERKRQIIRAFQIRSPRRKIEKIKDIDKTKEVYRVDWSK